MMRNYFGKIERENMDNLIRLKEALANVEYVVIGAGAGLSTSGGFTYSGERLQKYFFDFVKKYNFSDMYSGGFYPFEKKEIFWAYWSRYIYINRYAPISKPVYNLLFDLVKDKNYFVITTNVDHQFQKANFDKNRLFYTQGDYGLFQCSIPCCQKTWDNEEIIIKMLLSQCCLIDENKNLILSEDVKMEIPNELIPKCPEKGEDISMNLRADDTFVQDKGWYQASERYHNFLRKCKNKKVLFLDLGSGMNTPSIFKYPFWQMTYEWKNAIYACINFGEAFTIDEIVEKSICINDDIFTVLQKI